MSNHKQETYTPPKGYEYVRDLDRNPLFRPPHPDEHYEGMNDDGSSDGTAHRRDTRYWTSGPRRILRLLPASVEVEQPRDSEVEVFDALVDAGIVKPCLDDQPQVEQESAEGRHTPGTLDIISVSPQNNVGYRYYLSPLHGWSVASVSNQEDDAECEANARLLKAAWNSYARNCGPRAVECAEDDLLGQLAAFVFRIGQPHVRGGDKEPRPLICGACSQLMHICDARHDDTCLGNVARALLSKLPKEGK